jgi:hypothetical protein
MMRTLKGCKSALKRSCLHPFRVRERIYLVPEVFASLRPPATILQPFGLLRFTEERAKFSLTMNERNSDTKREMLRHTVATLAYRGAKALRGAHDSFATFKASETTRTPAEILAHVGDLLEWALSIARGNETWHDSKPLAWPQEIKRFHSALAAFDQYLGSDAELSASCERLFQGPIADALTHVGQIAMLRRIAGEPIKGENYSRAKIEAGRVGAEQEQPKREFD